MVAATNENQPKQPFRDDTDIVAALVRMLSASGLDPVRIDAMISKTARPAANGAGSSKLAEVPLAMSRRA